jgi:hypothetical protein
MVNRNNPLARKASPPRPPPKMPGGGAVPDFGDGFGVDDGDDEDERAPPLDLTRDDDDDEAPIVTAADLEFPDKARAELVDPELCDRDMEIPVKYQDRETGQWFNKTVVSRAPDGRQIGLRELRASQMLGGISFELHTPFNRQRVLMLARMMTQIVKVPKALLEYAESDFAFLCDVNARLVEHEETFRPSNARTGEGPKTRARFTVGALARCASEVRE